MGPPTLSNYNPYENVSRATRYIEVENERMREASRQYDIDRMKWVMRDMQEEINDLKAKVSTLKKELQPVKKKKQKEFDRQHRSWFNAPFWEIFKRPAFK